MLPIDRSRSGTTRAELWAALLSRRFAQLTFGTLLAVIAAMGIAIHFIPMNIDCGLSTTAAAAGLIGLSSIAGRFVIGFLIDRSPGRYIGAVTFTFPAIAALLAVLNPGGLSAAAIAILLAVALGSEIEVSG